MDRVIVYPGQVPLETDLLNTNKNTMLAIGRLAALAGGPKPNTNAWAEGLAVTQTPVASLSVNIGPGSMYISQVVDSTTYSSIPADTANSIPKQGINLGTSTVTLNKAGLTAGNMQYVVIVGQVANPEDSADSTVLPYYNSNSSSVALNGPSNTGTSQPRRRTPTLSFSAVYGTPVSTSGTALVPTLSAGQIGLAKILLKSTTTTLTSSTDTSTNAQIAPHDDEPRNFAPYASLGADNKFTGNQSFGSGAVFAGQTLFNSFAPTSAKSTTFDGLVRRDQFEINTSGSLYIPCATNTGTVLRLLVVWGGGTYQSTSAGAAQTIAFPIAFDSNVYSLNVTPLTGTSVGATMWAGLTAVSGKFPNFALRGTTPSGGLLASCDFKYLAVGI